MKAILKTAEGFGHIACQEIPEPVPKADEVKIKVAYAGICGTDLSIYTGAKAVCPPIVMGHEFSGVITEKGSAVTGWEVGDRVIAETTKESCGHCEYCKTGRHSLCAERRALGQQVDGVFAEYVCQKAEMLHKIPENVSLLEASMAEPSACAYHAVFDLNGVKAIDKTVVIGPGPMGLLATQLLKAAGAYVIVAGIHGDESRLKLAAELGADHTALIDDLKPLIQELTSGVGVDYVFDCAGVESSIRTAISLAKRTGTIVQVGIPSSKGVTLTNYNDVVLKELRIIGSFSHRYWDWEPVLGLMDRGLLCVKSLASHFFTLEECEKAFAAKDKVKVIFKISPELDENQEENIDVKL